MSACQRVCRAQTVLPFARRSEAAQEEYMRVEVKLANGADMRLDLVRTGPAGAAARLVPGQTTRC